MPINKGSNITIHAATIIHHELFYQLPTKKASVREIPTTAAGHPFVHSYFLGGSGLMADPEIARVKRFASGLRGLQSAGGKDTCQNFSLGCTNSRPISGLPSSPTSTSTTVHSITCSEEIFRSVMTWPFTTGSFKATSPPCAFTTNVVPVSSNGSPVALFPNTRMGIETARRWLRRWLTNCMRGLGFSVTGMLTLIYMHERDRW
jgi:hypothetical protein